MIAISFVRSVIASGVQKTRDCPPYGFIFLRRLVGEVMQTAMHIGIFMRVSSGDRINHHLRLLRRGAIAELDQWLAFDFTRQDR